MCLSAVAVDAVVGGLAGAKADEIADTKPAKKNGRNCENGHEPGDPEEWQEGDEDVDFEPFNQMRSDEIRRREKEGQTKEF